LKFDNADPVSHTWVAEIKSWLVDPSRIDHFFLTCALNVRFQGNTVAQLECAAGTFGKGSLVCSLGAEVVQHKVPQQHLPKVGSISINGHRSLAPL
jgi:hypothetical protein